MPFFFSSIELSTTPLRQIGLAQKIVVANRHGAQILVGLHVLNVGFDDRVVAPDRGVFVVLARDDAIDRLIDRNSRAGGRNAGLRLSLVSRRLRLCCAPATPARAPAKIVKRPKFFHVLRIAFPFQYANSK